MPHIHHTAAAHTSPPPSQPSSDALAQAHTLTLTTSGECYGPADAAAAPGAQPVAQDPGRLLLLHGRRAGGWARLGRGRALVHKVDALLDAGAQLRLERRQALRLQLAQAPQRQELLRVAGCEFAGLVYFLRTRLGTKVTSGVLPAAALLKRLHACHLQHARAPRQQNSCAGSVIQIRGLLGVAWQGLFIHVLCR